MFTARYGLDPQTCLRWFIVFSCSPRIHGQGNLELWPITFKGLVFVHRDLDIFVNRSPKRQRSEVITKCVHEQDN